MGFAGAFTDGRLSIGITKFDDNYEKQLKKMKSARTRNREEIVTTRSATTKVAKDVKNATNIDMSESAIMPLSGKWALTCSMLESCILHDPKDELNEMFCDGVSHLKSYPHLSLPGGQELTHDKIIEVSTPKEVALMLKDASGITSLKQR